MTENQYDFVLGTIQFIWCALFLLVLVVAFLYSEENEARHKVAIAFVVLLILNWIAYYLISGV